MYQGGRLTICEETLILRPHIDDDDDDDDGCRPVGSLSSVSAFGRFLLVCFYSDLAICLL